MLSPFVQRFAPRSTTTGRALVSRRGLLAGLGAGVAGAALVRPGAAARAAIYGNRIPRNWYWFQGLGTSTEGYGDHPYETFAYDSALRAGGIEDYNVVPYTSVLPKIAHGNILEEPVAADGSIHRPDAVAMVPGSVAEVIMSQVGMTVPAGAKGTVATALGIRWAAETATPGTLRNGYAAEYVKTYDHAVPKAEAEAASRDAVLKALDHELSIRDLSPYEAEPDPKLHVLASELDNAGAAGPLYVTQLTGICCYGYEFPDFE